MQASGSARTQEIWYWVHKMGPDREREIRKRRRKVSKDNDGGFNPDRTLSLMCETRKENGKSENEDGNSAKIMMEALTLRGL